MRWRTCSAPSRGGGACLIVISVQGLIHNKKLDRLFILWRIVTVEQNEFDVSDHFLEELLK